jgi:hypothetical protein
MVAEKRTADFVVSTDPFVSVLQSFRGLIADGPLGWEFQAQGERKFRLLVANTPELRERAFRLGARIYKQMGYIPESGPELLASHFDARPDTFVLLAADEQGRDAATLTLVFDSEEDGLPLDDIYQEEADVLRARGRRVAELVRFAVDDSVRGNREVLIHIFNFCYVFARLVMNYTDFAVTVNPRHAAYYRKLLGFEIMGEERVCPKVQGAPAVLLRVSFEYGAERVRASGGKQQRSREDRSLYPFFYAPEAEPFIAAFLKHRHKPMTAPEMERLGLKKMCHPFAQAI